MRRCWKAGAVLALITVIIFLSRSDILFLSVEEEYELPAKLLLTLGVDPDGEPAWIDRGTRPLYKAVLCRPEMVTLLLRHGARPQQGDDLISIVAARGSLCPDEAKRILDDLIAHGQPVEGAQGAERRPIHEAHGKEVIEFLFTRGARLSLPSDGTTVLHEPQLWCAIDTILARGADPNARTADGASPLMRIAAWRQPSSDRRLDQYDMGCMSSLDAARKLLAHGADPNLADNEGKTALDIAYEGKDEALAALLRQHGAKPSAYGSPEEAAAVAEVRADNAAIYQLTGLSRPRHGTRCSFEFRSDSTDIAGGANGWAIPLGTAAMLHASCTVPGYVHYAILKDANSPDVRLNIPVGRLAEPAPVFFQTPVEQAPIHFYYSESPIQSLGKGLRTGDAGKVLSRVLTVAPLRTRSHARGR